MSDSELMSDPEAEIMIAIHKIGLQTDKNMAKKPENVEVINAFKKEMNKIVIMYNGSGN